MDEHINQMTDADAGDVYCLEGNVTLHDVTPVQGEQERIVFVTAYSEFTPLEDENNN